MAATGLALSGALSLLYSATAAASPMMLDRPSAASPVEHVQYGGGSERRAYDGDRYRSRSRYGDRRKYGGRHASNDDYRRKRRRLDYPQPRLSYREQERDYTRYERRPPRVHYAVEPPRARAAPSLSHREERSPPRDGQQAVAREIVVLLDQSQPFLLSVELARAYRLERLSNRDVGLLGARAELFGNRSGRPDASVVAALQQDPRVRWAQLNHRYFHSADGSRPAPAIPQYALQRMQIHDAHKIARGRNVVIAVVDSAVDITHPDFNGAVVSSFDAVNRRDAVPDFHGTAVAGLIGARGVVEGVATQAQIMAVRAFRAAGPRAQADTTTYILLTAIDWAVKNGARVLNLSFVGSRDTAVEALLQLAQHNGAVVVAAAGNAGPTAPPAYPAAYPGVIAVTAVDEGDRRYRHANRGNYIAVAAPGVDILAPVERGRYSYLSGTSFAAAYVSGIAALLLSNNPNLDPKAVADLIAAGADDLGTIGRDDDFGAGRVNALSSLKAMSPSLATGK